MDWLANLVSLLPLDSISDALSRLTIWWSHLVADVPPDMLPMYAYLGFSVIVLLLWLFIVRVLPSPIDGISWLALFSVLLAPGSASGDTGEIAPASIAVVYGMLMKEPGFALANMVPILVVFTVGLLLGFIWQMIRNAIDANLQKSRKALIAEELQNTQLVSVNSNNMSGFDSTSNINSDAINRNNTSKNTISAQDISNKQPTVNDKSMVSASVDSKQDD